MFIQFTVKICRYLNGETRITTLHISEENIKRALDGAHQYCQGARESNPEAIFDVAEITRQPHGIECDIGWETSDEYVARKETKSNE